MRNSSKVDGYLNLLSYSQRDALEQIRQITLNIAPDAEEVISYGMPGFKYKGKYLLGYAAFKDHLSLFPTAGPIEAFQNQLKDFKLSKGTIHFTVDRPIPEPLLRQIIEYRVQEILNFKE